MRVLLFIVTTSLQIFSCAGLTANFEPDSITVQTSAEKRVRLTLSNLPEDVISRINDRNFLEIHSRAEDIAKILNHEEITFQRIDAQERWETEFDVYGVFMGLSDVRVRILRTNSQPEESSESLQVIVVRPDRIIDKAFLYVVIVCLGIIFLNFGAALNVSNIKLAFRRPVGASIGIIGTFVFMPLLAYGMGSLLFMNMESENGNALALGLFFCGVVPGGGFSNVWTLLLNGNIDLSVSMTTISTISAFGMIPLWLFTLGRVIFERANLSVPYLRIMLSAAGLVIPLTIGYLVKKWKPNVANIMTRILKPLSVVLLLLIGVLAITANFYMFQLFTWEVRNCFDSKRSKKRLIY